MTLQVKCPQCDTLQPHDHAHCSHCGADLSTAPLVTTKQPSPQTSPAPQQTSQEKRPTHNWTFFVGLTGAIFAYATSENLAIACVTGFLVWLTASRFVRIFSPGTALRIRNLFFIVLLVMIGFTLIVVLISDQP